MRRVQKRPRRWASLDADYLTRPRIVELRRAFGPAGPLALLAIILECEQTEHGQATDTVEVRYGPLGETVCATADEVQGIVELAASLKLVEIVRRHDGGATVELLERRRWAPRRMDPKRPVPRRIPTDERVLSALASGPLSGPELAEAVGLLYSGSFRARLKRLREAGRIASDGGMYRAAE